MMIHWENIHWETDDVGTSWASLADEEHNSLTLENRDGAITFHTSGSPRFAADAVLDIVALCAILSKDALGRAAGTRQRGVTSRKTRARAASVVVPEQRGAPLPQRQRARAEH